ncbi:MULTISPECIES: hypothetical protein [unclassified Leifsonia]|uniref:SLAC1 family transporter n=1 Tax=unclassified Leifsonia TaxID=2663824 RepID=UPI0006F2AFEC|nr:MULTISPECIES: hypothetical protein [unclassified Leifsonia]KQX06895.1 hypothetical protein ASC59_03460 [Leifsonia sp. Root1293]KRA11180.1 hypothetical protein ASD61_03460 [Leifsonia sp. Root60]
MTSVAGQRIPPRIPLNTLAIPFGLVGLAGCWSSAAAAFGWPRWSAEPFWILAGCALIWLLIAHAVRGHRAAETVLVQLREPAQGPVAAIVPITIMLFGAHLVPTLPTVGTILVYAGAAGSALFGAWLIAQWIRRPVPARSIHGGFLLPTVAAGFIGAEAAAVIGNTDLAMAAFGMGALFWVVVFTIVLARLAVVDPLPDPLMPTLAILAAPPAVGGMAWLALNGRVIDVLTVVLFGSTVFMVLIQLALLPTYRRLTFSLGFWSFTFSTAAIASQIIILSGLSRFAGWQVVVVIALGIVSILILSIAVRSVAEWRSRARGTGDDVARLAAADAAVERTASDTPSQDERSAPTSEVTHEH